MGIIETFRKDGVTMNDICIMGIALAYFVIGIVVSFIIIKMLCNDKKTNKHNYSFNKYAEEHSFEVFIIMLLWPVYVFMSLVTFIFVRFMKRFKW